MDIRKANYKDLEIIAQLAVQLWPDHRINELIEEYSVLLNSSDASIFLVSVVDCTIGFAQCQLRYDYVEGTGSSPVGYLEGIFFVEQYRDRALEGRY